MKSNLLSLMLTSASRWRQLIQWSFFGWCIFVGVQFALFVRHFESLGATPSYLRPPAVEGFLPIGSLVSLKHWIVNGKFDMVHPAALVLFLTFVGMSLLAKKSFCSFICPVGTLSEGGWKLGRKVFGRNFRLWQWLDPVARVLKYALLLFFVKIILIDMPAAALDGFLSAPYWAIADVKMLYFLTRMSTTSLVTILVLSLLSVLFQNFWCRFLCPYGALLGLVSLLSPFRIRRDPSRCSGCGSCSRACPTLIDVQHKTSIYSPECTGCMTCVSRCPEAGALQMSFWYKRVPGLAFVGLVVLLFAAGVLAGMLSGHWQSHLTYDDFMQLIPLVSKF
jgi:polyferredoxin